MTFWGKSKWGSRQRKEEAKRIHEILFPDSPFGSAAQPLDGKWRNRRIDTEALGLDPVWWTLSERRIRCPQWQAQARCGGRGGRFSEEFKTGAVRLVVDEGKTVGGVARDLDLTESALRIWVARARADRTKGRTGVTTEEREELRRLRKENRVLRIEREILKNAAAFFAKENL